jgi:uncharacterized protein YdaU (DUF1376 family)
MADKADIWMPLYIGDYLSATTHLSAEESGGYLHLLMHQWKNGSLPAEEESLRRIARIDKDAWSIAWASLKQFFDHATGVPVQLNLEKIRAEWNARKATAVAKAEAAAAKRWSKHAPSNAPSNAQAMPQSCPSPSPSSIEVQKQKPSRDKREADPRSGDFRRACEAYYRHKGFEMTWDASEAKHLSSLLASNPTLSVEQFQGILRNRSRSTVIHSERPRKWLSNAMDFAAGPIDRFNKPLEAGNARAFNQSKSGQVIDDLRRSLEEDGYSLGLGEIGDTANGESRQGNDGYVRCGPDGDGGDGRSIGSGIAILPPAS